MRRVGVDARDPRKSRSVRHSRKCRFNDRAGARSKGRRSACRASVLWPLPALQLPRAGGRQPSLPAISPLRYARAASRLGTANSTAGGRPNQPRYSRTSSTNSKLSGPASSNGSRAGALGERKNPPVATTSLSATGLSAPVSGMTGKYGKLDRPRMSAGGVLDMSRNAHNPNAARCQTGRNAAPDQTRGSDDSDTVQGDLR